MKAYIAVSFSKKEELKKETEAITDALSHAGFAAFVFVNQYQFEPAAEKEMMRAALAEINSCDLLIAETSEKAIGVGVEAGYAKAKDKPLIYVRKFIASHSTTVAGISDFQILYHSPEDLQQQLDPVLVSIKEKLKER